MILDFVLAPANVHDLTVGAELLADQRELPVLSDNAYYCVPVAAAP